MTFLRSNQGTGRSVVRSFEESWSSQPSTHVFYIQYILTMRYWASMAGPNTRCALSFLAFNFVRALSKHIQGRDRNPLNFPEPFPHVRPLLLVGGILVILLLRQRGDDKIWVSTKRLCIHIVSFVCIAKKKRMSGAWDKTDMFLVCSAFSRRTAVLRILMGYVTL